MRPKNAPSVCCCGDHAWMPLTKGYVVLVSPEDAHHLATRNWSALTPASGLVYALAHRGILLHRLIFAPTASHVDHEDGNGLNNRRRNLRACSTSQNQGNQRRRTAKPKTSQFRGVSFDPARAQWIADISVNNRSVKVGRFSLETEAARAYDAAATKHFGAFARTNFPTPETTKAPAPARSQGGQLKT